MKTLIFGAGIMGKYLCKILRYNDEYDAVGFVDNNTALTGQTLYDLPIYSPAQIMSEGVFFDKIHIAIKNTEAEQSIYNQLLNMGIDQTKILIYRAVDHDSDIRFKLIMHYAEWLSDTPGNVAECGVFRGVLAKEINRYFYSRKLYLFDTFEGFDERDIAAERAFENDEFNKSALNDVGWLSETSAEYVMNKMPHPEDVIIKKGYVPETFADVDDSFCFVSLDMDLYQPTLAALKFFWERMPDGGIMLLHDYLTPETPGVKKAVEDFEKHLGKRVNKDITIDGLSIAIFKTF